MNGYHTFDHAAQEGNVWLHNVAETLGVESGQQAYGALRATLHALRDRLPPEDAVHFSAQLPLIIRGLFFDGWKMSRTPDEDDTIVAFCERVEGELPPAFPIDSRTVVHGIFDVLWRRVDAGETAKIIERLPHALRVLWPLTARREAGARL